MSFPKTDKKPLPATRADLAMQIAGALKRDVGQTHAAVKTVSCWTGAHERTAKQWLSGRICPRGDHLVQLVRNSDQVFEVVLLSSERSDSTIPRKLGQIHDLLLDLRKLMEVKSQFDLQALERLRREKPVKSPT